MSAKALRLYEARGLLVPDAHSDAGYRLYGAPALAHLMDNAMFAYIREGMQAAGLKLSA